MTNLNKVFQNSDDFTVFLPAAEARDSGILAYQRCAADLQVLLKPSEEDASVSGRALACLCYQQKFVSITVRPEEKVNSQKAWTRNPVDLKNIVKQLETSPYNPNPKRPNPEQSNPEQKKPAAPQGTMEKVVSIHALCECLYDLIFAPLNGLPSGLVVVAGRTGSAKSKTVRGLIYNLLTDTNAIQAWNIAKEGRRPHLVTLEDPLEKPLYHAPQLSPEWQQERQIDYTPRDKSAKDFTSLDEALSNALRQTPTVVYVGEVRDLSDWRAVIKFAGTGHLVITTAHAGSVTETLATIFESVGARNPEDFGSIAQRILAVIHQCPLELAQKSALIPTVWRNTPAGVAGLVSEGLSSVLPHFPLQGKEGEKSSLGRRCFVRKLLTPEEAAQFDSPAFQRDLMGM